jgi:hypothetical protein
MQLVELALEQRWGLKLKGGSMQLLVMDGAPDFQPPDGWELVTCMHALGHILASDPRSEACIAACVRSCWAAFWRSFNDSIRACSLQAQGSLFNRACTSVFRYRCPRWPWFKKVETLLEVQQSRMLGALVGVKLLGGELWPDFHRRRRFVVDVMKVLMWSDVWADASASWLRHLARHPYSLPSRALQVQGVQAEVNHENRTTNMLSNRRSALGTHRTLLHPVRSLETIENIRSGHRGFSVVSSVRMTFCGAGLFV